MGSSLPVSLKTGAVTLLTHPTLGVKHLSVIGSVLTAVVCPLDQSFKTDDNSIMVVNR